MILKVKKGNFFIYVISLVIGVVCITVASVCVKTGICKEVLLSFGAGVLSTVFTTFLLDYVSEKREARKKESFEKWCVGLISHDILRIMRIVIESFSPCNDCNSKSFKECFQDSIKNMQRIDSPFRQSNESRETYDAVIKKLDNALTVCAGDCRPIVNQKFMLRLNETLTADQLSDIENILGECDEIVSPNHGLGIKADSIEAFVDGFLKAFPKIREKTSRIVQIKNKKIQNFSDISK